MIPQPNENGLKGYGVVSTFLEPGVLVNTCFIPGIFLRDRYESRAPKLADKISLIFTLTAMSVLKNHFNNA